MSEILSATMPEYLIARRAAARRERRNVIVGIVATLLCLVGGGMLLGPINRIRRERQLVIDPRTIASLPPGISLLGKLGTFRALAIDWASIRAERLKEEGRNYEALQLHDAICRLAPRFPKMWVNAAWNMAYNISVNQYTPEQRWQWVQNGIKILRDEALQYNPRSVTLYKELAWIYWHKIGDILDDEHLNYKRVLAVDMERVLGAPPVAVSDDEYFGWFRKIVDADRDLVHFLSTDAEVSSFVGDLESVGLIPDDTLLEFVSRYVRPELQASELLEKPPELDPQFAARLALLKDPLKQGAVDRVLAAVRSDILRRKYKLDVDLMYRLMAEEYGPLDWRNAYAHTLYWSTMGDRISEGYENTNINDAINTARFIFFALQSLIMRGRIVLWPNFDDPYSSYLDMTPDVRFIPYLFHAYLRLGKKYFADHPKFVEDTPGPIYMNGFVTNMENWIQLLYLEGGEENIKQAENYFVYLREYNPHPDGSTQSRYLTTVDEFVMGDILNQLDTSRAANGMIRGFINRGLKHLGLGQFQAGLTAFQRARYGYDYWMRDSEVDINERRQLQPILVILRDQIIQFLQQPELDPLFKARLWRSLPLEQRQMTFDALRPYFEKLCADQSPPWTVERAFGEPPGMEAFRKLPLELRGLPRREDMEQGERFKG